MGNRKFSEFDPGWMRCSQRLSSMDIRGAGACHFRRQKPTQVILIRTLPERVIPSFLVRAEAPGLNKASSIHFIVAVPGEVAA
jgi:hypothetical protein